ncbi:phosphonate C-P lyase system protein PhnL [Rhodomicrobium vannielii ATCC 17100]|uniref:phosphonate C-P lyase system protein PhnL n=1 Tax=Rhodomicrobium vannielii TaxID=1069 RepID=UPI0019195CA7|nr:phosphonate C-P lyase system protein PhnL [Rhodomicrobium vannielii]MBJ7532994.1 phosphonate C-P lyase system protein PhnL [Rhodomicrobium vannielii ATCC 17100]
MPMKPVLEISGVSKSFTMHLQGGVRLPVMANVAFDVRAGECVVIVGPSGAGKSSVLKMIYGSYGCDSGRIVVTHRGEATDLVQALPRQILALRRETIGYVSQFLRAVPRVPALDVVVEPLVARGASRDEARDKAAAMLTRLNVPQRLFGLPPSTFSGGEQQRVNIARGLLPDYALLLLDEPTASLDAKNRAVVVDLINARKRSGAAIIAIVHDEDVRDAIADRIVDAAHFSAAAA